MYPRSWKDQPEACEAVPVVATFPVGPRRVEIRAGERPEEQHLSREYLVTTGSLFGSQTLRVWGEDSLFEVLSIAGSGKAEASLPRNVTVVE